MEHGAKARRAAKCNPPSLLRYNRYAALTRPTNLPDGQISKNLSSLFCKNILIFRNRKSLLYLPPSRPIEGRFAIVTDAGRDAVDADAPITNGAEADGEGVWS
jgi:hypothetical protein